MKNKLFNIFQIVVTILSFYYLYIFFTKEYNSININLTYNSSNFFVLLFLFASNYLHSLGWASLNLQSNGLNSKKTILFAMKSHIGKYSFIKFGNFFIRLSQNFEKTQKKDFFTNMFLEQFIFVFFGLMFGIFIKLPSFYNTIKYLLIFIFLIIILFLIQKFNSKNKNLENNKNFLIYYLLTILSQFAALNLFFFNFSINDFILYSSVYLFSSAISMIVSIFPAGLGVKESIVIFITSLFTENTDLLNILITVRSLFIFSDILSYIYSIILLKKVT